jgi:hypothetical protein
MKRLLIEIKILIAEHNCIVWYHLYRYDEQFREYAESPPGRQHFINQFTRTITTPECIKTTLFNKLHSINDRPAIVWANGTQEWYNAGILARDVNLPNVVIQDHIYWMRNKPDRDFSKPIITFTPSDQIEFHGEHHREHDLPAAISRIGNVFYFINDKLHRDNDLPAAIYQDGTEMWFRNGKLHRDFGLPAVKYANGICEWYKNGVLIV